MNVKCRYNEAMLVDESCSGLYDLQTRDGRRGGDVRGGEEDARDDGIEDKPRSGAIRKVLQKELAFMATKNVNKRIVRAIWC